MPCHNHSHRETTNSVWVCAENTQRLPSSEEAIVAPSVTRQHTTSNAHNRKCKNRGENGPKSRQHLHTRRASCGRVAMSARDASPRPAVAKSIHADHCANTYVCVLEKRKKRGAQEGTSGRQEAQLDGSDTCGAASTSTITHGGSTPSTKARKEKKHGGRAWLCVCGAAGVCPPWPQENKTRGKEMCAPPHRPSSHAHTSRLPQRAVRRGPSSCVRQARRTGPSS
ncbi:hypothetical protein ECC02_012394 [Trypanosoma cruzi]|uniref:Uncharacterized protein n=1 Tax=Trypanosoma cruzi TaxID=5693 RepID=A0A7J6XKB2_TRYCR|nr:hypothetical protein ECC02_012394 [Trypanosoma cruzi]